MTEVHTKVDVLRTQADDERWRQAEAHLGGFIGVFAFAMGMAAGWTRIGEVASEHPALARAMLPQVPLLLLTTVSIGPLVATAWRHLQPTLLVTASAVADIGFGLLGHAFRFGMMLLVVGAPGIQVRASLGLPIDGPFVRTLVGWASLFWAASVWGTYALQRDRRRALERA